MSGGDSFFTLINQPSSFCNCFSSLACQRRAAQTWWRYPLVGTCWLPGMWAEVGCSAPPEPWEDDEGPGLPGQPRWPRLLGSCTQEMSGSGGIPPAGMKHRRLPSWAHSQTQTISWVPQGVKVPEMLEKTLAENLSKAAKLNGGNRNP